MHRLDTYLRSGNGPATVAAPQLPMVPGREVAGVVDRVGEGVDDGWLGKPVVTHLGPQGSGGYAELALADAARCLRAALRARRRHRGRGHRHRPHRRRAVLDFAAITADDVVVVTSAAGGPRHAPDPGRTQCRRSCRGPGQRAQAPCGAPVRRRHDGRLPRSRVAGRAARRRAAADRPPRRRRWPGAPHRARDARARRAHRALLRRPRATTPPTARWSTSSDRRSSAASWSSRRRPSTAAADGSRVPYVGTALPLADAALAHEALESREAIGKVVLEVTR